MVGHGHSWDVPGGRRMVHVLNRRTRSSKLLVSLASTPVASLDYFERKKERKKEGKRRSYAAAVSLSQHKPSIHTSIHLCPVIALHSTDTSCPALPSNRPQSRQKGHKGLVVRCAQLAVDQKHANLCPNVGSLGRRGRRRWISS